MTHKNSYVTAQYKAPIKYPFSHKLMAISIAAAMLPISALQAQEAQQGVSGPIEEVVVLGVRASIARSLDIKRESASIVDAITSTDIGKLPDATITDSLQRVTGVQIVRSGGEGASLTIRGNSNVMTTLNGEHMISASTLTSVQPNFAEIPSTMVSGMTVVKSPTASTMIGGLTGSIDLQTYRPLTLDEGLTFTAKAEAGRGTLTKKTDPSIAAFTAFNFDNRFAASLNVSYSDNNLADDVVGSTGEDWGFAATESSNFALGDAGVDANRDDLSAVLNPATGLYTTGGTADDRYYAFQGHEATNRWLNRERLGVNGSFQWVINDAFELTTDVFYTHMDEHQYEASFVASQAWQGVTGWFDPAPNGLTNHPLRLDDETDTGDASLITVQDALWQSRRNMAHSETNWIEKEALNTNIQIDYDNGGAFTATLRYVHGEGKEDSELSVTDAYMNNGSQGDAFVKGVGGENLGPVNPWGYSGVPGSAHQLIVDENTGEQSWSRQEADFLVVPVGVGYTGSAQNWNLPLFSVAGAPILNESGQVVLRSNTPDALFTRDADGNLAAYTGGTEVMGENVNRYSLTSANLTGYYRHAEMDAIRFDGRLELSAGHLVSLDMGLRFGEREVKQDNWVGVGMHTNNYGDRFVARWKDPNTQAPLTGESYTPTIAFSDIVGSVRSFNAPSNVTGINQYWAIDPEAMGRPSEFHQRMYGNQAQLADPALTYTFKESTTNAYLQANFEGDVFSIPYSANAGLRISRIEMDINQTEVASAKTFTIGGQVFLAGPGAPSVAAGQLTTQRNDTELLPALNIAFDITQNQKIRLAYSSNMSNHNADMLAGGVSVNRILGCGLKTDTGEVIFCATAASAVGNPNLEPWRTTNMDVSWEWYFSDLAMLSAAAFTYDYDSLINRATWEDPNIADSDGVVRGWDVASNQLTGTVTTSGFVNGAGGGRTQGVELGYQQELDDIIENTPLSGLGWQLNYTWSPSKSGIPDYYGKALPLGQNSEHVFNLVGFYENHGWEARIAYNYRSERYISQQVVAPLAPLARTAKAQGFLDMSVRYSPLDNLTLALQATNVLEEHEEQYLQWEDLVDKRIYSERRITFGVQYRL